MAQKMAADLASGDSEKQNHLRGLIGSVLQSNPELQRRYGLTPKDVERQLQTMAGHKEPKAGAPATRPPQPRVERPPAPERPPPPPPKGNPAELAARRQWTNRIAEWAERFPRDQLSGSFRDSPAIRDLVRRLTEAATDALRSTGASEGLDAQLARWETKWKSASDWLPHELPAALRMWPMHDLTSMPHVNWQLPDIDVSPPALSSRELSPPDVELGAVANVVFALAGVVVMAALVWRLRASRSTPDAAGLRPLGPWPLDPARVTSRAELIRAFEYLSLLRLGEPARAWHHRAIAANLAGSGTVRREAADRLAALYEQARYTPLAGGEADWTAARGPLLMLAGAG
jgi:hypothetical protein